MALSGELCVMPASSGAEWRVLVYEGEMDFDNGRTSDVINGAGVSDDLRRLGRTEESLSVRSLAIRAQLPIKCGRSFGGDGVWERRTSQIRSISTGSEFCGSGSLKIRSMHEIRMENAAKTPQSIKKGEKADNGKMYRKIQPFRCNISSFLRKEKSTAEIFLDFECRKSGLFFVQNSHKVCAAPSECRSGGRKMAVKDDYGENG